MAVAVLGHFNDNDLINNRVMRSTRRLDRRHYKKDSRFVLDLYTLTYDSHESLDSLGDLTDRRCESLDVQNLTSPWLKNNINTRNGRNNNTMGYRYRRPSLQSRLQDGKNLQLCFVNEQSSETEDSHTEDGIFSLPAMPQTNYTLQNKALNSLPVARENVELCHRPIGTTREIYPLEDNNNNNNTNYHLCNAEDKENSEDTSQTNINWDTTRWSSALRHEVCTSLKKVYEETRRKIESDHRQRSDSPITCTIKTSLKKVGAESGNSYSGRQRMSRHMLTKMNADQLQVIINDLHAHVEYLNEQLMNMLMERDELHMSRDSLLVDIEDLTAYLDAKQIYKKNDIQFNRLNENYIKNNNRGNVPGSCTKNLISGLRFNRFASYIKN